MGTSSSVEITMIQMEGNTLADTVIVIWILLVVFVSDNEATMPGEKSYIFT